MLHSLAVALGATEQDHVGSSWSPHGELIESQTFTTSLLNTSTSGRGEAQGADGQFWDFIESVVIRNRADYRPDLALVCLGTLWVVGDGDDFREGNRRAIDLAHAEAAKDGLIECRIGTSAQEAVELVQESEIRVLAMRSLPVAVYHMVFVKIDLRSGISIFHGKFCRLNLN